MTRTGKNDDAANEKAAPTRNRISAGVRVATHAAAKATTSNSTLDRITRRPGPMWGETILNSMSWESAFDSVSNKPSAVDSAAASAPAATRPEMT